MASLHDNISTRRTRGTAGEDRASEYLRACGYIIEARNYRTRYGEVDIVARRDNRFHFIEVRTRQSDTYGSPAESVTTHKIETIAAVAESYLADRALSDVSWQIDLICITPADGITQYSNIS